MKTKIHSSVPSPSRRLLAAGLVAMTILAARLQAQYVSTAISNGLSNPSGVTVDASGNVYMTDTDNNRVVELASGSTNVTTLAGGDGSGSYGTNNGVGAAARFAQPQGIVYDTYRRGLVVVDQYNQLLRFVTITNGVGTVSTLAGVYSQYGGLVNGSNNVAQFSYPDAIALDSAGNLYISEWGNNDIRVLYTNNMVSNLPVTGHTFDAPSAIALDANNDVWVADSGHNVICMISNGVAQVMAGNGSAGTNDSLVATNAEFSWPSGLFWDANNNILVISDTLNDTIRSLFLTNNYLGVPGYAVQTIAGIPGTHGLINGALGTAEFFHPYGLCADLSVSGYYVVDSGNNALRVLQPTEPPPPPVPVPNPQIGYVTFPIVNGVPSAMFNPITAPVSIFNNVPILAIEQLDPTVQTYMSYGPTGSFIPAPGPSTGQVAPEVFTGSDIDTPPPFPSLDITIMPSLTLETISEATGRPSSAAISAEFDFVTSNPNIIGNDAADIVLSNATLGAQMYYVLDNSTNAPTNDGSYGIGPIGSGQTLALDITSNVTLKVRAFMNGFAPSGTVSELLTVSNFIGNQLTFGFASGYCSSKFVTAAGRYYYAPVTLTELPGATMYSLQFNLTENNNGTAPAIDDTTWQFYSMLMQPTTNVPPELFSIQPGIVTNTATGYTNGPGEFLNDNLLGIGWIETYPHTNLYNTTTQDLTDFSEAHDIELFETGGQVIVGAYGFPIPSGAAIGNTYTIQAGLPSATTYFPPDEAPYSVFIQAPTNGSMTNGAINSIKTVTVGTASYLVGDVYPFSWFNAGDFGAGTLQNIDVIEVFQSAIYSNNVPPHNSDFFDAMDSSDGTYNNLYDANDADINSIQNGDGFLKVDDVYVTFKRSLDTNLTWWVRSWSNGVESFTPFTNFATPAIHPEPTNGPRYVTVAASEVQSGGTLSVQVPVQVWNINTNPVRVMMLRVEVDPLDGSPPLTNQIAFSSVTNLGALFYSASQGSNDYGAVWLNSGAPGVSSNGVLGTLSVTLPSNVTSNSAYRVHFDHFSASPNGIALFHSTAQDGLITVGDRSGSSWGDGIPDSWRLLWFGTVSNALSAANADPDGDGASNWAEYVAGTNPLDSTSVFQLQPGGSSSSSSFTLQWPSVVNKSYTVQSSSSLTSGSWTTLATNIVGNGQTMQWTDSNGIGQARFYRALVQ
ncbi:MAG: hypothetical protein ACLQU4_04905 [Limisphaerales bacterium]